MSKERNELYEFAGFRLDVREHTLERADRGESISLPEKAFQTLCVLVQNSGHLMTKQELLDRVWPDSFVEENNLDKSIHAIRNALGEKSGGQKYIETVRKHGYRFVADVRALERDNGLPTDAAKAAAAGGDGGNTRSVLPLMGSKSGAGGRFKNAFEAYQQARIRYGQMTALTSIEARELIGEALRLDPGFAPTYSLSAELTTLEVIVGLKSPADGFAEARGAIARAYELGADSADFYAAAGYVDLIADWNFRASEKNLRKALAISPHHSSANRMLGEVFMFQCRHDEAATYVGRAQTDEVTALHSANVLAISRFLARDFPAVIEVCDRMLSLYPRFMIAAWTKCWALEQMGRPDEAIAGYEKILRLPYGEPAMRWIGYAYAMAGDRQRALDTAARLEAAGLEHSISPTHLTAIYAALGDHEQAISNVERSVEMRDPWMLWTNADPRFDSLRGDRRFGQILNRIFPQTEERPAGKDRSSAAKAGALAALVQGPVLTESGQHALVTLAEWQELAKLSKRTKQPFIPGPPHEQVVGAEKADLPISSGKNASSRRNRPKYFYLAAAVVILIGSLALGGWFVNGSRQGAEDAAAPGALGSESRSSEAVPGDSGRSRAYDLYVRGKVKVANENREDTEAAIKLLEEAIAIDPNFAGAYAQLARGYNTMAFKYSVDADSKRFHENAEVAIEKALTLDPNLAEGHFARGLILWTNRKGFPHAQAIQSYKRALALDPSLDEVHHQLSLVYSHIGLLEEARNSAKTALELNPNNTLARYRAGVYVAYEGKFEEAIAIYKTVPRDFTPLLVDRSMAEAFIQTGRTSEAEAIMNSYLSKFPQDEGGSFTSVKALLLARAGRVQEAEHAIRQAAEIGGGYGHFHHTTYNIASAYAIMNRPEEAVKWLEITAERGFPNYSYFQIDPNLDNMRNHTLYRQFMSKLKPQWDRYRALG